MFEDLTLFSYCILINAYFGSLSYAILIFFCESKVYRHIRSLKIWILGLHKLIQQRVHIINLNKLNNKGFCKLRPCSNGIDRKSYVPILNSFDERYGKQWKHHLLMNYVMLFYHIFNSLIMFKCIFLVIILILQSFKNLHCELMIFSILKSTKRIPLWIH